ncbi:MAG: serine phosphatase RsbU (regulator of sigma subunit) [Arenicella sp.]|jgi:serine phosphatase RsbU (regulator of sigma subunit)
MFPERSGRLGKTRSKELAKHICRHYLPKVSLPSHSMKLLLLISILLLSQLSFSQEARTLDEVKSEIKNNSSILDKINLHFEAYKICVADRAIDNGFYHVNAAIKLSESEKLSHETALAYYYKGRMYNYSGDAIESSVWYNKALRVPEGLTAAERVGAMNSDAVIYLNFSEFDKAIEIYKNTFTDLKAAAEETGRSYAFIYNNLGYAYSNQGDLDSSMHYHLKCRDERIETNDTLGLGQTYFNMGALFYEMKDFDASLEAYETSLEYRLSFSICPESALIESNIGIGKALVSLKRYGHAEKILKSQEKICGSIVEYGELRHRATRQLMRLYQETDRHELAFEYAERYYLMKDSLFDITKREEIIQLNSKNKYQDKVLKDSLAYAEKERLAEIQKQKEEEIQEHKDLANRAFQIGMIITLVLMVGIIVLVYRNYKSKKRASEEILLQKLEVEKQRDIARTQKEEIAQIHEEITDSIIYAERIQTSIFPSSDYINAALGDNFIYYQPKAIVAGDFYWVHEVDDLIFFTAADCTGHGVPGALVSIVCSNALSRSVEECGLRDPGKILDKTKELVVEAFSKNDELVKDGMDLSFCCIDKSKSQMLFSGANNPVYIVKKRTADLVLDEKLIYNEDHYLLEIKGDKQAVGYTEKSAPFKTQIIPLEKGDVIYSITDGLPDQFGGPKGKKLKYKTLKSILLQNHELPMTEQESELEKEFQDWRGDLEQVDDICIIGVRF